jgi:hypothetical protein
LPALAVAMATRAVMRLNTQAVTDSVTDSLKKNSIPNFNFLFLPLSAEMNRFLEKL